MNESTPPPFGPNLESLVWPLSPEQFLDDYWNRHCFVSHGGLSRLSSLAHDLDPSDVPGILAQSSSNFVLSTPGWNDPSSPQPQSMTAIETYERGAGSLYIHLYDGSDNPSRPDSKRWKKWLVQISSDLGRLIPEGKISIYASKESVGLKPHFDPNDNYTIQLKGRKRWYYTDENPFRAPNHTSGTAFLSGKDLDQHVFSTAARGYVRNVHAITPPSRWESAVLEPGSMLYVPRGFWHGTESLETSISLNISLAPGHWANYLLPLIGRLVLRDPEWRETAHLGNAPGTIDIERLLHKLKSEIETLEATDFLPIHSTVHNGPQIHDDMLLRHRIFTQYYVQHSQHLSENVDVLFVDLRGQPSRIKLPRDTLKTLEWIECQRIPFTIANLKKRLTSTTLSPERFVGELIGADYLEIA